MSLVPTEFPTMSNGIANAFRNVAAVTGNVLRESQNQWHSPVGTDLPSPCFRRGLPE